MALKKSKVQLGTSYRWQGRTKQNVYSEQGKEVMLVIKFYTP